MESASAGSGLTGCATTGEVFVAAGAEARGVCGSAAVLLAAQPARNRAIDPTCNIRTGLNIIILMETLYITHPECLLHEMGAWHPETSDRLDAINDQLLARGVMDYVCPAQGGLADATEILRVNTPENLAARKSVEQGKEESE